MTGFSYMSAINPIRFFDYEKVPKDWYAQKFADVDDTFIQIITDNSTFSLKVIDGKGIDRTVAGSIKQLEPVEIGDMIFITFAIKFVGYNGGYQFVLTEIQAGSERVYYSMPFCVGSQYRDLMKLHYRNQFKDGDVVYKTEPDGEGIDIFSLRVEGGFEEKNYIPKSNDTIYMKGDYKYHLLHSLVYYTRQLTVGDTFGIADELFHTINHIFGCDTVFIDFSSFTKFEGAQWSFSEVEHYPLRTWQIELAPTNKILDRADICNSLFCTGYLHPDHYLFNDSFIKIF